MAREHHHILVVDDDERSTTLLCAYLARYGFVAHAADGGAAMRKVLAAERIDLCILDLMLPGEDGLELVRELRQGSRLPVIMVTGRGSPADRVVGLEMGADDYMTKPFEPRELVARVHAVLRRAAYVTTPRPTTIGDVIRFDGWALERESRKLTSPAGREVELSNAEYQLLSTFLKAPRRVVSRDHLMSEARGRPLDGAERSIDLLVSRLRQKLASQSDRAELIKTVRGTGYMFDAAAVQVQPALAH